MWGMIADFFRLHPPEGRKPYAKRSPKWAAVRAAHLKRFPTCAACGSTKNLECHHLWPFHLYPSLELSPENLLTLCEGDTCNCHLVFGHAGRWNLFSPYAREDAAAHLARRKQCREKPAA